MSTVLVETLEPGIAQVTMNRPERRNALNPELVVDLTEALSDLAHAHLPREARPALEAALASKI